MRYTQSFSSLIAGIAFAIFSILMMNVGYAEIVPISNKMKYNIYFSSPLITGQVIDKSTGQPIAGALVSSVWMMSKVITDSDQRIVFPYMAKFTYTDENGNFQLEKTLLIKDEKYEWAEGEQPVVRIFKDQYVGTALNGIKIINRENMYDSNTNNIHNLRDGLYQFKQTVMLDRINDNEKRVLEILSWKNYIENLLAPLDKRERSDFGDDIYRLTEFHAVACAKTWMTYSDRVKACYPSDRHMLAKLDENIKTEQKQERMEYLKSNDPIMYQLEILFSDYQKEKPKVIIITPGEDIAIPVQITR